eukprot:scaffold113158_cov46-Prasinocladus_malaysianus.AAC.1
MRDERTTAVHAANYALQDDDLEGTELKDHHRFCPEARCVAPICGFICAPGICRTTVHQRPAKCADNKQYQVEDSPSFHAKDYPGNKHRNRQGPNFTPAADIGRQQAAHHASQVPEAKQQPKGLSSVVCMIVVRYHALTGWNHQG